MIAEHQPKPSVSNTLPRTRRFVLRLEHIWLALVPLLVALKVLLTPIAPHDFWWHLAYGRTIIASGSIPRIDTFAYTRPGAVYFDQPWLAQVLMYSLYHRIGAAGLEIVQACLVAGAYLALIRICEAAGAGRKVAVATVLMAAAMAYDNWHIRPQTYALPLWVAALGIMQRWQRHGAGAWMLIPLVILWSNLHGTFVLPLVLGGSYLVGEGLRTWRLRGERTREDLGKLATALVLASLGTLLNPHGLWLWSYTLGLIRNTTVTHLVTEWAPPRFGTPTGTLFFSTCAAILLALFIRRKRVSLTTFFVLAPFALLAAQAGRNIIWFACAAAVCVAPLWQGRDRPRRYELPMMNAVLLGCLVLPVLLTLPPIKPVLALPPRLGALLDPATPIDAVERLRSLQQRPQRLFNDSGFGSYLIWAAPEQHVFIDARIEHYPLLQWQDYIKLGQGKDIAALTSRYHFDGFFLNPITQGKLIAALHQDPNWKETISTHEAILFQPSR